MVLLFAGGCLITFHKPIIWCWAWSTAFVVICTLLRRRLLKPLGRIIIITVSMVGAILVLDAFLPSGLLKGYINSYYLKFIRIDPVWGYSIGDPFGGRLYLWKWFWSLFLQCPLIGQGLGVGIELEHGIIIVHNLYLYFLVSVGILGSLIIIGLLISFLKSMLRSLRTDVDLDLRLGLAGYVVGIMAYNAVGMMFFFVPLVYLFGITIGLLLKMSALDKKPKLR